VLIVTALALLTDLVARAVEAIEEVGALATQNPA